MHGLRQFHADYLSYMNLDVFAAGFFGFVGPSNLMAEYYMVASTFIL
jgi:hypothetical protein